MRSYAKSNNLRKVLKLGKSFLFVFKESISAVTFDRSSKITQIQHIWSFRVQRFVYSYKTVLKTSQVQNQKLLFASKNSNRTQEPVRRKLTRSWSVVSYCPQNKTKNKSYSVLKKILIVRTSPSDVNGRYLEAVVFRYVLPLPKTSIKDVTLYSLSVLSRLPPPKFPRLFRLVPLKASRKIRSVAA